MKTLRQTTDLICGFWNVDGRPASESRLDGMAGQTFLLPGAEQDALLSGPVGLITSRRLRGAPARPTLGPQRAPEGSARRLLAFAGRLDNRAELASQGLTGSDPEVILGAYERWGTGAVERIEGDFVFALWDPAARRLVCARDAAGVRTLYFRFDGRTFSFGSQLRQLTPRGESLPSLDEEFFAHFLLEGDPHLTLTPFQGIEKLSAGYLLVVDEGGVRRERWWRPERQEKIHYADDSEYAEHFLELFRSSVAARLEAEGPVWSELSGGLDSSSIVCMAREIYGSQGVEQPDFTTLTWIFEDPRSGDAPAHYRAVIEHCGFKWETSVADARDLFEDMLEGAAFWEEPSQQIRFFSLQQGLSERTTRGGADAILAGVGAEVVVGFERPDPLHLLDLLRARRWSDFLEELRGYQESERMPYANMLARYVLRPLFGPPLNKYYDIELDVPAWIRDDLARRTNLRKRVNRGWMPRRFESVADQWLYEKIGRSQVMLYGGFLEKQLDWRYPYLSRSLLDFSLAVPYERKNRPGQFKPMLREAMRGILPDLVRIREDKGGLGPLVVRSMSRQWTRLEPLLRSPVLSELGFVDQEALYDMLRGLSFGQARRTVLLTAPLCLELWTRSVLEGDWQRKSADHSSRTTIGSILQPAREGGDYHARREA